jgi:histidyl-tRNA synthetase
MSYKRAKGTTDFYPEELAVRNKIFDLIRDIAKRYGFKEIESPAFENLDLLTKKEGADIKEQIFTLTKRGDEELGLRFDLTVPAARMFIEKQKVLPKPVKWFFLSRMWRYEQPQAGRLREFYQFSVETFGSSNPEADAEIINLAIDTLLALGLTKQDFTLRLNNRKLLQGLLLDVIEKSQLEGVIRLIDKSDKISEKEFDDELKKLKIKEIKSIKNIIGIKCIKDLEKLALNREAKQGLEELKNVLENLNSDFVKIDMSTVRGLAYYTGTVFEIFDSKQRYRAIAGGGRYDNLVEQFGGQPCPATGFGLGYSTLSLLLQEKNLIPEIDLGIDYYVAPVNDAVRKKALQIAERLRKKNTVEIDLTSRNLRNQLDYANSVQAKNVVIIGPKELEKDEVTIRDMNSGGEERVNIKKL